MIVAILLHFAILPQVTNGWINFAKGTDWSQSSNGQCLQCSGSSSRSPLIALQKQRPIPSKSFALSSLSNESSSPIFDEVPSNAPQSYLDRGTASTTKIHLLSLQWTAPTSTSSISQMEKDSQSFCKEVQHVWRWKDAVLGDGRDYFLPRTKTLQALRTYLLKHQTVLDDGNLLLHDCIILSNCARFELLLSVQHNRKGRQRENNQTEWKAELCELISKLIYQQVLAYEQHQEHPNFITSSLLLPHDWPDHILQDLNRANPDMQNCDACTTKEDTAIRTLSRYWTVLTGVEQVVRHLCEIAAGIALRPNRPHRAVPFQPYSSRDAHILLQLKRMVDATSSNPSTQWNSSTNISSSGREAPSTLKLLLQAALRAGKAVRNADIVPEIKELRHVGTGSKFSIVATAKVTGQVTKAAITKGINPVVSDCVERFQAREQTSKITTLRQSALNLAISEDEVLWVQEMLHAPTIRLRRGEDFDLNGFLEHIRRKLDAARSFKQ